MNIDNSAINLADFTKINIGLGSCIPVRRAGRAGYKADPSRGHKLEVGLLLVYYSFLASIRYTIILYNRQTHKNTDKHSNTNTV